jgi:hypothetical protein
MWIDCQQLCFGAVTFLAVNNSADDDVEKDSE